LRGEPSVQFWIGDGLGELVAKLRPLQSLSPGLES
jgi:hypothetical protein